MKLSGVLVICFTNLILRATSAYVPVDRGYNDNYSSYFLLAVFLSCLLLSLRKRKPVTAATTKTSTRITTTGKPSRCSVGYTFYAGPGRSFCYRYSSECKTWNAARTACQMENADLISLDDYSLQPFMEALKQELTGFPCSTIRQVWLGAKTNGTLVAIYIDNHSIPSDSPLWAARQPDTRGHCILSAFEPAETLLFDEPCIVTSNYVCQKL